MHGMGAWNRSFGTYKIEKNCARVFVSSKDMSPRVLPVRVGMEVLGILVEATGITVSTQVLSPL